MNLPTLEQLLDSGAHFGHRSSRWNPNMEPYIFTTRNKIHVIDLEKTQEKLKAAGEHASDLASRGEKILFVGTKRQAKGIVKEAAEKAGMPFVVERWLGGTFTNYKTIQKTIKKLKRLQRMREAEDFEVKYIKKERLIIEREIEKLERLFEGIKDMNEIPKAVFVVDVNHESIVVSEARRLGVEVFGLVDTNSDPSRIDYPIPANDDAIKSIKLLVNYIADSIVEGAKSAPKKEESNDTSDKTKKKKGDKK